MSTVTVRKLGILLVLVTVLQHIQPTTSLTCKGMERCSCTKKLVICSGSSRLPDRRSYPPGVGPELADFRNCAIRTEELSRFLGTFPSIRFLDLRDPIIPSNCAKINALKGMFPRVTILAPQCRDTGGEKTTTLTSVASLASIHESVTIDNSKNTTSNGTDRPVKMSKKKKTRKRKLLHHQHHHPEEEKAHTHRCAGDSSTNMHQDQDHQKNKDNHSNVSRDAIFLTIGAV